MGRLLPGLNDALDAVKVGTVSLPIALGLLAMMYPVLAKVRYDQVGAVARDRRLIVPSLLLNWVVGPALMFALAWIFLPDLPAYRTGLIIVGLARCIAMVLIWNDLAGGDREAAAVLVALNSLFQIVAYSLLGYFYLELLPGWLGLDTATLAVSLWEIARIVAIFLGVPLAAGYLTRRIAVRRRGNDWYEHRFLPRIAPVALWGLLFTIVVLFALQGDKITAEPLDVARIAVPLLAYFALMWGGSFALGYRIRLGYPALRPWRSPPPATTSNSRSGRDRRVRRDLRRSARRRRRTAHRSPRARRARVRIAMGSTPLLRHRTNGRENSAHGARSPKPPARPRGATMNCLDCATANIIDEPAIGNCIDCGSGVCLEHAVVRERHLTKTALVNRDVAVEPAARVLRCHVCDAARVAQHDRQLGHILQTAAPPAAPGSPARAA